MRPARWLLGTGLLAGGICYLGFAVDRVEALPLLLAFAVAFAGYAIVAGMTDGQWLRASVGVGLALRIALVFGFPRLSDDVYRFIWDGHLIVAGANPFDRTPTAYLEEPVPGLDTTLYAYLNSPDYHTVYPPVAQAVFTLAAWVSPRSWYGAATVMKLLLLLTECGTLYFLYRLLIGFGLPPGRLLLYWANPLIIVEIVGNLHFEGAMVCFLLASLCYLTRSRYGKAGAAMALSIASKLLPLMLLPFLLKRLWRRPFLVFFGVLALGCTVLFLPLVVGGGFLDGFTGSLDLYFRKFEFNASLYYLLREYGFYEVGYNRIARYGPLLARVAAGVIFIVALSEQRTDWRSLPAMWLAAFVIYLLGTTTVHPWYLAVPIALCCLTPWRFPLVWSVMIVVTYGSYATVPYRENLWLVSLEYLVVVGYFCYERAKLRASTPMY